MHHRFFVIPSQGCYVLRYSGHVSVADVMSLCLQVWADPKFEDDFDAIIDFRHAKIMKSFGDMPSLVNFFRSRKPATGRAAVIVEDKRLIELIAVFRASAQHLFSYEIVPSWEHACNVLGKSIKDGSSAPLSLDPVI